ncbi:hypothetical protein BACCAP_03313 [Pseudoflavonifractor capillosus ATCC 29799]|uniref:Uncharacterized protein n=1 Tax=Pseudoflavonifractor capillosus ATCC 29799 TaxID=411467 RepID=A6NYL2_9FIRM|nr:hypothetical protein BACCAP_03313 [Pseudoflavonifractor capillosus ATCC 29799]
MDLTAGSRLETIGNGRFEAALCCNYDEKEGRKWKKMKADGTDG